MYSLTSSYFLTNGFWFVLSLQKRPSVVDIFSFVIYLFIIFFKMMGFSRNYWIRKDFLLPRTMLWVRPRKDIIHSWDFAKRLSLSLNCTKSDLCVSDDLCLKCSNLTARAFNGRWPTENGFRKKTEMDFYLDQIVKSAIEHLGRGAELLLPRRRQLFPPNQYTRKCFISLVLQQFACN